MVLNLIKKLILDKYKNNYVFKKNVELFLLCYDSIKSKSKLYSFFSKELYFIFTNYLLVSFKIV